MNAATIKPEEITMLYGIAKKSCFDMTPAEFKQAAATALQRAKEAAFTRAVHATKTLPSP